MRVSILILLFFLLGLSVYFSVLLNGFVWDDYGQVVSNKIIQSLSNTPQFFLGSTFDPGGSGKLLGIYYKPLMTLSFSMLYALFGPDALFFHLFQILMHITNAILVYFLFLTFFRKTISILLGTVFLTHPQVVETVAYISALQDTLFFFFGMSAIILIHMKVKRTGVLVASIFLLASLLAKEAGILFVIIIAIYYILIIKKQVIYYFAASTISVLVYVYVRFGIAHVSFQTAPYIPIVKASFLERLLSMPKILLYYIGSFFFPRNLAIAQHWIVSKITFANFFLPLFIVLLFFAAVCFLWLNIRSHRKYASVFLFFFLWFLSGILFHLQIFPLSMTVADRWFYFPMVGLLGIFGVVIEWISSILPASILTRSTTKAAFICITGFLLVSLIVRTQIRIDNWKDNFTLYSHDIRITSDSFDLENGLGAELFKKGRIDEAKIHFEKSMTLVPLPVNLTNLGLVYKNSGDTKKAKMYFEQALNNPNGKSYITYEALASLILSENPSQSVSFTEKALKLFPYNSNLWMTLAMAEYQLGNDSKAASAAGRSVRLMSEKNYKRLLSDLHMQ